MERPDFASFRRHVLANIEADLAREDAQAEALKAAVLPRLRDEVQRARRERRCGRAWLFGSFAWGRPTDQSDLDVLVEDCPEPDALAGELWRALDRPVHVVTVQAAPDSLKTRVLSEGQAL